MTHLRTVSNIALLLVAWLAAGLNALAQPAPGLDPRDQALFERAVATSCLGDEAAELASAIRERRAALVPALRRALAAGPPQSAIAAVRSAAERTHAQRAKFVPDESRIGGVDREALARFRSVTRQAFVDDQVQRFVLGYRSNAWPRWLSAGMPRRAPRSNASRRTRAIRSAQRRASRWLRAYRTKGTFLPLAATLRG